MIKPTPHYFVALLVLIVLSTTVRAQLRSEFVSLQHPANFEEGGIQIGNDVIAIDKVEETQMPTQGGGMPAFKARLKGNAADLYVSEDNEEPTGRAVLLIAGGITYSGQNLSIQDVPSRVMHGHGIRVVSGALQAHNGQQLAVRIWLTESLLGGGSSELTIQGNQAILRGELGTRTYNQIFNLVYGNPSVRTLVLQDVPGSVNDEINMQTGRLVRMAGLHTHIPSSGKVHSGGVDLFCAGATRSVDPDATLGVHSWEDDHGEAAAFPRGHQTHLAQVRYFTEMLGATGEDFYYFTIYAAPANGMHRMTPSEIQRYGLVTH